MNKLRKLHHKGKLKSPTQTHAVVLSEMLKHETYAQETKHGNVCTCKDLEVLMGHKHAHGFCAARTAPLRRRQRVMLRFILFNTD